VLTTVGGHLDHVDCPPDSTSWWAFDEEGQRSNGIAWRMINYIHGISARIALLGPTFPGPKGHPSANLRRYRLRATGTYPQKGRCGGLLSRGVRVRVEVEPSHKSPFGKDAATVQLVFCLGCATNSVARLGKSSGQRYSSAAPFGCGIPPLTPNTGEFALKIFDLFGITVAASAGLCGAALTFSPDASAGGGAACVTNSSGPAAAAGGAACVDQMAGLAAPAAPVVLPGPPLDAVPPVPAAVPPVPAGFPAGGPILGAPVPAPVAAPLITQAGTGKGVPTNPSLAADPVVRPGPAPTPPGPASHQTLVTATEPLPAG
jgi:hypothetical protein